MSNTAQSKVVRIYLNPETQRGYSADTVANFYYDSNYGADADGRRGHGVWFCEDIDIKQWYYDDKEVSETKAFQGKRISERVLDRMDKAINNHDYTMDDCAGADDDRDPGDF